MNMAGYERKVVKFLKNDGYKIIRNPPGSHVIWSKGIIEVSVPAKIPSRHLANEILKDAGIGKKF